MCTIVDDCARIAESDLEPPFESPHLDFPDESHCESPSHLSQCAQLEVARYDVKMASWDRLSSTICVGMLAAPHWGGKTSLALSWLG